MNCSEFYDAFKEGLDLIGVGWRRMDLVQIGIREDVVLLKYGNLEVPISVPVETPRQEIKVSADSFGDCAGYLLAGLFFGVIAGFLLCVFILNYVPLGH